VPDAAPTLHPVAAAFVVFGSFWGSWTVAAADIEHELGLSHGTFGLLLSVGLAAAGLANALGGALAERRGTARVLAGGLVVWALFLVGAAAVDNRFALVCFILAAVATGGLVDTVMNVAATAALAGRPGALVRFHALFNGGAALGACATGLLIANNVSGKWWWMVVAAAALVVGVICARSTLHAGEPGEQVPLTAAFRVLRAEHLVLIATAFAVGSMVEGGVDLWGVLFLRTRLESGLAVAVTSAVAAYLIATTARVVFGPAAGRGGAARGVALGASAAVIGILVLALADASWMKGAGLVVAAGGISMCWPLLLAYATAGMDRPGAVVGAVTSIGYIGFFAGPTIVGWIASAAGLRAGLLVLAGAAVFVAVAPNLSPRRAPREPASQTRA
jgi:MFS family permease